jgi:hypothetical protein
MKFTVGADVRRLISRTPGAGASSRRLLQLVLKVRTLEAERSKLEIAAFSGFSFPLVTNRTPHENNP